jgi:hypothetical protein
MKLNKYKAHLLKLIIPFVWVMRIPRNADFKVVGPMICVQAEIKKTVEKVLPVDQDLVPVALKRKLEFCGDYLTEYVDRNKLMAFFEFFKLSNPLFKDVSFDYSKLDDLVNKVLKDVERQDEDKILLKEQDHLDLDSLNHFEEENCAEVDEVPDDATLEEEVINDMPNYLCPIDLDTLVCL